MATEAGPRTEGRAGAGLAVYKPLRILKNVLCRSDSFSQLRNQATCSINPFEVGLSRLVPALGSLNPLGTASRQV